LKPTCDVFILHITGIILKMKKTKQIKLPFKKQYKILQIKRIFLAQTSHEAALILGN